MTWPAPAVLEARDVEVGASAIGALARTPPFRGGVFAAACEYAVAVVVGADGMPHLRVYLVPPLGDRV